MKRQAYFTWFPHLIPAVSVRQGDWKLIRRFEPHPAYPEVRELYNLKEDIGETRNLAMRMPDKVKQLDALIDQFIERTGALTPRPNPAYQGRPDVTDGLVPRGCKLVKVEEAIRIVGNGRTPFLGTARVHLRGPLKVTLTVRSAQGGEGRVHWKMREQKAFPETGQSVVYKLPAGKSWQKIALDLPIKGRPQIVRLYFPVQEASIELQSIRFRDIQGREKVWDFSR